jgi:hypothetical protein
MSSHLVLISQLYHESKRLSEVILRDIARDVVERMDREKQNMWTNSLSGALNRSQGARGKRSKSNKTRGA